MGRLEGKGAVVLGAAGRGNMGQVIARRFADEGARVLVAGRHADELERFAGEIDGAWALCDITNRDQVFALAETSKRTGESQGLEQVLLDLMSLGQRFNWGEIVAFVGPIQEPETLRLPEAAIATSAEILARCGNMSSPTILFVLRRLQEQGATPPCVVLGFGPGLVAEAALLE